MAVRQAPGHHPLNFTSARNKHHLLPNTEILDFNEYNSSLGQFLKWSARLMLDTARNAKFTEQSSHHYMTLLKGFFFKAAKIELSGPCTGQLGRTQCCAADWGA